MPEYIEREDYCKNQCRCANEYCDKAHCPIWKAPAADVAPVVHGRWQCEASVYWQVIPSGGEEFTRISYRCVRCGCKTSIMSNFCPNCGSKRG